MTRTTASPPTTPLEFSELPASDVGLRTCVKDLLGDREPEVRDVLRVIEFFLNHDFMPLRREVKQQRRALDNINDTLIEWRASLRILIWVSAVVGGLISALGTVLGIFIALRTLIP